MLTAIMLAFIIGQQTNNAGRIQAEPPKPESRLKQLLKDRVDAKKVNGRGLDQTERPKSSVLSRNSNGAD